MPVYDYECDACGPFTTMRPMAQCEAPARCPGCGGKAPRAYLTAPYFAMPAERRRAHATNEKSAHAPRLRSELDARHGAGCSCCGRPSRRKAQRDRDGARSFPASRPWMISH